MINAFWLIDNIKCLKHKYVLLSKNTASTQNQSSYNKRFINYDLKTFVEVVYFNINNPSKDYEVIWKDLTLVLGKKISITNSSISKK